MKMKTYNNFEYEIRDNTENRLSIVIPFTFDDDE